MNNKIARFSLSLLYMVVSVVLSFALVAIPQTGMISQLMLALGIIAGGCIYTMVRIAKKHRALKQVAAVLILLCVLVVPVSAEQWDSNTTIVSGLGDTGTYSRPDVFNNAGVLTLISGDDSGTFSGFTWSGGSWSSNATVIAGLGDIGSLSSPTVFDDGGTLKLISGSSSTTLYGFEWNGSGWYSNASIVSGLSGDCSSQTMPVVFNDSGTLKIIVTNAFAGICSYDWSGSAWVSNSSVKSGLTSTQYQSTIYSDAGVFKLIRGTFGGTFSAYYWTGSTWTLDSNITTGLTDVGQSSAPAVYLDSGNFHLISGEDQGGYYGFWQSTPRLSAISEPSFETVATWDYNETATGFFGDQSTDWTTDGAQSYRIGSPPTIQDLTISTYGSITQTVNFTNIDSITFDAGFSHDPPAFTQSYTNFVSSMYVDDDVKWSLPQTGLYTAQRIDVSNVTGVHTLRFALIYENINFGYAGQNILYIDNIIANSLPTISSATISPSPTNASDDLTAVVVSSSDLDGDTITYYYKWYKDSVHQPTLDNSSVVLSDNTSAGESWRVSIIPNDGYENGTLVQSATVTIDSPNVAPTLTSVAANASVKFNKSITITTTGANDVNADNYSLSIGTTSGDDDLCIGTNVTNGTQAACSFLMPWTSGAHVLYGFLNDGVDSSIAYYDIITVDTTPPVIGTTSLSSTSALTGENITITASVTVADGSISTVYAAVNGANYAMSGSGGTYTYIFTSNAGGDYSVTYSATDDSGNTGYKLIPNTFSLIPSEGSGGGGGGDTYINETVLGALELTPTDRDVYFFYTGYGEWQTVNYTYDLNRNVKSCKVEPNHNAVCEVSTEYSDIITVRLRFNGSQAYYDGILTVVDADGYVQSAKLTVRVTSVHGAKLFDTPFYVGQELAELLKPIAPIDDKGNLLGLRWWSMFAALGILSMVVFRDSQRSGR